MCRLLFSLGRLALYYESTDARYMKLNTIADEILFNESDKFPAASHCLAQTTFLTDVAAGPALGCSWAAAIGWLPARRSQAAP